MSCPSLLNEDTSVPKVTSAKSLGVHDDEALTWAAHIEEISKKLTSEIGANRTFTIAALFGSFFFSNGTDIKPLAIQMFKVHNNVAPEYLSQNF